MIRLSNAVSISLLSVIRLSNAVSISLLSWLLLACFPASAAAAPTGIVRVIEGPTPIPNGKCRAAHDLTLLNDRVAFSFAVDTARPWGNPAGAILDGGLVVDGVVQKDRISFVDFLPDGWKPWPHVRQEIRIVENGPDRAVLEVSRDFGGNPLVTTWTLLAGSSELAVVTVLGNRSKKRLVGLLSGYSFCTKDGNSFVPETVREVPWPAAPGANNGAVQPGTPSLDGDAGTELPSWAAGYGPDWSGGLQFVGADQVTGGKSWKDLYRTTTVEPGSEVRFEAIYSLSPSPDISGLAVAAARRAGRATGSVTGTVRTLAGRPVALPYIFVETQQGKVVGWAAGGGDPGCTPGTAGCGDGTYSFELPEGHWNLRAAAVDHRSSDVREVVVAAGSRRTVDFDGLEPPGTVHMRVRLAEPRDGSSLSGAAAAGLTSMAKADGKAACASRPVDARIVRMGTPPPVRHVERFVTYTDLARPGETAFACPPGEHEFLVSHGGGFLAPPERVRLVVSSGGTVEAEVLLRVDESPPAHGWYCADLHHHSDHADGRNSPEDLVLSESAAGLDYAFVSDHDFTGNHAAIAELAETRGLQLMAGIEVSPSFGHFNLFPLPIGADPGIDSADTTPRQIFDAARRLGALVQANHPMDSGNAYLRSHLLGTVPGGFSLDFDLIELNADDEFDDSDREALEQAFKFWDEGFAFWLSAGSDTHDVHTMDSDEVSGRARTCVHVTQDDSRAIPSPQAFESALKAGRAVATFGPLVFPHYEPGSEVPVGEDGQIRLPLTIYAASGIAQVRVRSSGGILWSTPLEGCPRHAVPQPAFASAGATWYLVEVVDCSGNPAFVNPVRSRPLPPP